MLGLSFRYGYITLKQFQSFLPDDYVAAKEAKFKAKEGNGGDLEKLWKDLLNDTDAKDLYTRTFNADYGTWIAEHNAVVKINDTVFLHAGFSEPFSTWKLETINSVLTKELKEFMDDIAYRRQQPRNTRIVYQPQGPLWYRDLVSKDEALMEKEFGRILANLGAKSMVVAHTPTQSAVSMEYMNRFGKRLFMIDTSISSFMGMGEGQPSALIIENGKFRVWPEEKTSGPGSQAREDHQQAGRKVNHETDRSGYGVSVGHRLLWQGYPPF